MTKKSKIDHYSDKEALDFHIKGKSGKIEIHSSKPLTTKRDLSLAYSPGVAAPVKEIAKNPDLVYDYTSKGNLVAVISNGSAILGLGNLGSLASKPVMEGKSVLFKRFADIDSIDIEIDNKNTDSIIDTIKNISGTFGGINLEDIAAQMLASSLGIPFDIDKSWDEKRQQWSISGKIYKSQNITMTAKGDKSGKWTTVFSAACLIL